MSHVTSVNESCHISSHVTSVNASCHICGAVGLSGSAVELLCDLAGEIVVGVGCGVCGVANVWKRACEREIKKGRDMGGLGER